MGQNALGTLLVALASGAALTSGAAGANSGGARWPSAMNDCTDATAVVVASDLAAQSDVYSAVTLAGVLDTNCLIDAGARDQPMPSTSATMLDAASTNVYVVGGTSALPDSKLHTRSVHRIAGTDRWATARAVGQVAADIAAGNTIAFTHINAPVAALSPAAAGANSGGARWPSAMNDCTDATAVVVASDLAAQSDVYSAVTLAGVLDTNCLIDAGARDQPMPRTSATMLDAASTNVYVVGGTSALPDSKLHTRSVHRIAGTDRWATARAVGQVAADIAAGNTIAFTHINAPTHPIDVQVSNANPTVGDDLVVIATATDDDGAPLCGAELQFFIDGESQGTATTDCEGRATFTYDTPFGSPNEGGYDSIQVIVASTEAASRPQGVFWMPPESRRITISVSPDASHSSAARTITARAFDDENPIAFRIVELYIDGTLTGRAATNGEGLVQFTHTAPVHGPFDLAKVALNADRSVVSNEVLISWPMKTKGADHRNDWALVWSDEFTGASLNPSKWTVSNNCPPVYLACDTDRPENVYVSDGLLHLRTLREPYAGANTWKGSGNQFGPLTNYTPGQHQRKDFTSGRVDSNASFTYGRFEMLGKLPQGHGTFFAYWLKPRDTPYGSGAAGGEIDIAEGANINVTNDGRVGIDAQPPGPGWGVHHVVHMGYPFTNPFSLTNLPVNPAESFHLYAVEWDTASIRFYVDDTRVLTVPQSDWFAQTRGSDEPVDNPNAPFDVPFYIVINNTVGNWALETWPGNRVPDSTVFPAEFAVDYMRVYECRPPSGTSVAGPGQGCETP
ncbi:family 16 glycosylhydrolase [Candidatus Poriferisodalis sp.]|uniref:family 16 glycosylhydrolase n=1 Tax=Candidatus Poriferisodalis sp. TaxID=3101277 RepID=UPI003B01A112